MVAVQRIEAEHAQQSRQPPEMCVRDETQSPLRFRTQSKQRTYIEGFEYRVHRNPVTFAYPVGEIDRFTVNDNEFDLGVRNTRGFYRVLDGRGTCAVVVELALATSRRQKIIQFFIEAESNPRHLNTRFEPSAGGVRSLVMFPNGRAQPDRACLPAQQDESPIGNRLYLRRRRARFGTNYSDPGSGLFTPPPFGVMPLRFLRRPYQTTPQR